MNISHCLFVLLIFFSIPLKESTYALIVWNTGQGQFLTYINDTECVHIDMGGESFLFQNKLSRFCRRKQNFLLLTHWDWDHVSWITKAKRSLRGLCLLKGPKPPNKSKSKWRIYNHLTACKGKTKTHIQTIQPKHLQSRLKLSANDQSFIYVLNRQILIPGDSTKRLEKYWANKISQPQSVHTLILGHHGSVTSTSTQLLKKLPNLQHVIASARKTKYGHPHFNTQKNVLLETGLTLFSTEQYGHIYIQQRPKPFRSTAYKKRPTK